MMTRKWKITLATIGVVLAVVFLLFGNSIYGEITNRPGQETGQPVLVSEVPPTDQPLANDNGCFECHSMNQKNIGPAFRDIAARYNSDARDTLIEIVKHGGKGNWTEITGGVPMPPYSPRLTDSEIEQLVDWILDL